MDPAEIIRIKELLPTTLGSEDIREQIARDILQRSLFSARMASLPYLRRLREVCEQVVAGSINQADARNMLQAALEGLGHSYDDPGGIQNPMSARRLNLIIDTQRQMAASVATLAEQTPAVVDAYPAWELTRLVGKSEPRADWMGRWSAAASAVGWDGVYRSFRRFVALKSSPVWQALGDGAGGFDDALGNPYPPFAYNSGMAWLDVDRDEAIMLGLVKDDEVVNAPELPSLAPKADDWEALIDVGVSVT